MLNYNKTFLGSLFIFLKICYYLYRGYAYEEEKIKGR